MRIAIAAYLGCLLVLGCGSGTQGALRPRAEEPKSFSYYAADGSRVTSTMLLGRVSVIMFATTYDAASQLEVLELQRLYHRHQPRINVVVVMLETAQYAPLTGVYAESLGLDFPVVIADYATRTGSGDFGELKRVPTTFLLDREGRVIWSMVGAVSGTQLDTELRRATGPR